MAAPQRDNPNRHNANIEQPDPQQSHSIIHRIYSFIPSIPHRRATPNIRPNTAPNLETKPTTPELHTDDQDPLLPLRLALPIDERQLCPYDPTHYHSFPSIERNRCSSLLCGRRQHPFRSATAGPSIILRPCSREGQPCLHIADESNGRSLSRSSRRPNPHTRDSLSRITEGLNAEEIFPPRPATPARRALAPTTHGTATSPLSTGSPRRASVPNLSPLNTLFTLSRSSSPTARPPTRHGPLPESQRGFDFSTLGDLLSRSPSSPHGQTSPTRPRSPKLHHIHGLPHSHDYPYVHRSEVALHLEALRARSPSPLIFDARVYVGGEGNQLRAASLLNVSGQDYSDTVFHYPRWGGSSSVSLLAAQSSTSTATYTPTSKTRSKSRCRSHTKSHRIDERNTSSHPPFRKRPAGIRRVSFDLGSGSTSSGVTLSSPLVSGFFVRPRPATAALGDGHAEAGLGSGFAERLGSVGLEVELERSRVYRVHGHGHVHAHAHPHTYPHTPPHTHPPESPESSPRTDNTPQRTALTRNPTSTSTVYSDTTSTSTPTPTPTPTPATQTPSIFAGRRLELRGGSSPEPLTPRLRGGTGNRRDLSSNPRVKPHKGDEDKRPRPNDRDRHNRTSNSPSPRGHYSTLQTPHSHPHCRLQALLPPIFHRCQNRLPTPSWEEVRQIRLRPDERVPKLLWFLAGGKGRPVVAGEWKAMREWERSWTERRERMGGRGRRADGYERHSRGSSTSSSGSSGKSQKGGRERLMGGGRGPGTADNNKGIRASAGVTSVATAATVSHGGSVRGNVRGSAWSVADVGGRAVAGGAAGNGDNPAGSVARSARRSAAASVAGSARSHQSGGVREVTGAPAGGDAAGTGDAAVAATARGEGAAEQVEIAGDREGDVAPNDGAANGA
ncbi:hypothetical protein P154DRAFT_539195 [Amniculicola lignicola CBS 123094]|uniref:Uncharacterized protein n=1 Tax=Amniculicola lignicola CBS 123094 TaxID=1392246 RepID=A0A6A5VYZ2_9PLEO|nr:hypothetical protein P154DRAFT_539195 [Amniculicola lignicola CBS 123094]